MIRIVRTGKAVDRDARHALQRFGDGAIGQGADVFRRDGVDHGIGVALEILRIGQRLTNAADDDDVFIDHGRFGALFRLARLVYFCCLRPILRNGSLASQQSAKSKRRCACPQPTPKYKQIALFTSSIQRYRLNHRHPP